MIADEINATLAMNTALAPGDVIEVRFPYESAWNQTVMVEKNGTGSFLLAGRMQVAGLTPEQLGEKLEKTYTEVNEDLKPNIVVESLGARTVTVTGEVVSPNAYEIPDSGRLTLVEALALAGGIELQSAQLDNLLLVRWDPQKKRQTAWKIDASPAYWASEVPLYLQTNDIVYVPNKPITEVGMFVQNYITNLIPIPLGVQLQVGGDR